MKITVLGTGTSQGVPVVGCECNVCQSTDSRDNRLRVSVFIQCPDGTKILIDTSPDLRQQLLKNKITDINAILVTHEHNDHIIGLDDIRAINFRQNVNMPMYALPRVVDTIRNKFDYAFGNTPYPGAPMLETFVIGNDPVSIGTNTINPIKLMHGPLEILGYRIKDFAYLTDIKTIAEAEKEKLQDLEVLVISALRIKEHFSHMNLEETLMLIAELKPKKSYLTHISHVFATHVEIENMLPNNVHVAYDGLTLEVN